MRYTRLPELDHPLARLRPLRADDIGPWYAALSQPQVFAHTSWNLQAAQDLALYAQPPDPTNAAAMLRLAIAARDDDRLLGTAGFHSVWPPDRRAEIAYDLVPAAWGQGLATAAVKALLDWGHGHVGLVRIQATVLVSNAPSLAVLGRCGFAREGLLRSYRQVRGRSGDFWLYAHVAP